MYRSNKTHSMLAIEWVCIFLIAFSFAAATAAASVAPTVDPEQLLKKADSIKSANHDEFTDLLIQIDIESARLTLSQQMYLRYLKGWQSAYFGDLSTAIPQLSAVFDNAHDLTLRFRAGVTVVNALQLSSRNEEAYTRLSQLLDLLPHVSDDEARTQGLGVAAQLYNQGGQYDLALKLAARLIAENRTAKGACIGGYERLVALYKSGKLQEFGNEVEDAENACVRIREPVFTGLIRVNYAKFMIAQGKYKDAIVLLKDNEAESNSTHYKRLISAYDSILAQAYWKAGDTQDAQQYASSALDNAIKNEFTEPLIDTYEVLYQVAQKQGDYEAAFALHEKYAAADKGYLNDASARALAYQMVKQQVQEKKQQIDALSKKNQVLQLQQAVSAKSVVASRLWIALLITVLASIVLYAYRTKRAQLKFMNLARRDGLTGIFNRQHFIWEAERALEYTAKSVRDACVIVIDLDHFKLINDDHGHAAGDTVLKRTVAACLEQLREVDVFGRLGGEEFGIFMPDCVPERAVDVAEAMRKTIAGLCDLEEDAIEFPAYASFGISSARWSGYNLRQLLAHADSALYQAKREGRNRVAICDESTPVPPGLPAGILDRRRG